MLTPSDDAVGPVEVRVVSNGQTSNQAIMNLQPFAPALLTFDGKHAATAPGDNSLLDKSGTFFSAATLPAPVKHGDTIVLYGTGFGPTDPVVPAGQVPDGAASLTTPVTITIGGAPATVTFSGLAPPFPHIYQFNVQVPDGLADGHQLRSRCKTERHETDRLAYVSAPQSQTDADLPRRRSGRRLGTRIGTLLACVVQSGRLAVRRCTAVGIRGSDWPPAAGNDGQPGSNHYGF